VSSQVPKPVSTHGVLADARSETLANLWQMTLRAEVEDALCLVELRGFEPLTPCMPSRNPSRSAPTKPYIAGHSTEVVLVTRGVSRGLVRLELLPPCCPPQPSWSMCRSCCRVRVRVPTVRNRRLQRGGRLQGRPAAAGQTGTAAPLEAAGAHSGSGRHRPGC
jgi:hypothetical protein